MDRLGRGGVRLFGREQRRGADLVAIVILLGAALLGLMTAYGRAPELEVGIVSNRDPRYRHFGYHLQNFHEPEALAGQTLPTYRWTQANSTINLPNIGRGLWHTQLTLGSPPIDGTSKQATITSGAVTWRLQLQPEQRTYHLLTRSNGDVRFTIEADAKPYGNDPRSLGVVFGGLTLQPVVAAAFPPVSFLLYTLLALTLIFATLRLMGVPTLLALSAPLVGLLLLAWGIATQRAPTGLYSLRLLALALVGLLVMLAVRWALPRLLLLGGIEVSTPVLTALLALIYISFLLRGAGLLWPYFLSVDIEWHMEKTQRVLNGRIGELWDANSPFHQSVMPVDEWGETKPVIPYSPFYHIFSAIWAIFPWPLKLSAEIFNAVLDALRPAMIFFIVRKFGFNNRAALIGAFTYSIIPATFLLHAWGNMPTTNGMWWSLLATTLLVGGWGRLRSPWVWGALTFTLTLTLLFYAVTAVFTTLLILGIVAALLVTRQRQEAWPLLASIVAAVLLSTGIYYWQFVLPIIERTIPRLMGGVAERGQTLGGQPIFSWSEYLVKYVYLVDIYGMYLPLGLGIAGWWLGIRKLGGRSLFALLMTTWMVIAILFWFVGLKLSMVDKQLFWLMPWMGIGAGIAVDRLLHQRRIVRWALPLLIVGALFTGSDALYLWTHRLNGYDIGEGYTSWYQLACRSLYDRQTCIPE